MYELTGRPAAIEDRFGNLLAWAGPDRPDPYPKADPAQQDRLLDRAMSAAGPVREGGRLLSVAALGGSPVAVLVLHDPAGTAADTERVAVEHATTVLTKRSPGCSTWPRAKRGCGPTSCSTWSGTPARTRPRC